MTTRLLLVCSAGMSTSLLVNRMKAAAKANGQDIVVEAVAAADAKQRLAAFGGIWPRYFVAWPPSEVHVAGVRARGIYARASHRHDRLQ